MPNGEPPDPQRTVPADDRETLLEAGVRPSVGAPPAGVAPAPRSLGAAGVDAAAEYAIEKFVGRGGMGDVYAARHRPTDRLVAIKVSRRSDDPVHAEQILWEAQVTAKLEHPAIVPVHDIGIVQPAGPPAPGLDAQQPFYAMRLVSDGRTWDRRIASLGLRENLEILIRIADAVRFAHSRGVIHRDLKPANVMLGDFGEIFLMDWGLAASLDGTDADGVMARPLGARSKSARALSPGTPAYAPPEQALGDAERIGKATDIYLLGAMLFEIIFGAPPHGAGADAALLRKAAANVIDWRAVPEELRELADIAAKALADQPDNRFADVDEMQSELRRWLRRSDGFELLARAGRELAAASARTGDPDPGEAYAAFERSRGMLEAAAELLPDVREARTLAVRLDNAHAAFAADRGDLDLAQSRLPADGDAETERLRARIREQCSLRTRRARRARQFRWVLASTAAAAALALLFIAYEAEKTKQALWRLSGRMFADGMASRSLGHDQEAARNLAEAHGLFVSLGRDPEPVALALADLRDPEKAARVAASPLSHAVLADAPVQAWAFPDGRAVCLARGGAAAIDAATGDARWEWIAPGGATGRWTASPLGRVGLFVTDGPGRAFHLLDLTTGTPLGSGLMEKDWLLENPRRAVADAGRLFLIAGRNAAGDWSVIVLEHEDGEWRARAYRYARDLDVAVFVDADTLVLSSPRKGEYGGRHLMVVRRDGEWRLRKPFGRRPGNSAQGAYLSRDGSRLTIAYARPPADGEGVNDAHHPPGTVEEWLLDGEEPELAGRGRRYPDRRLAGLGRWLDVSHAPGGWPKTILFNANSASGLVVLLRLDGRTHRPVILRALTSRCYRNDDDHTYVVAGRLAGDGGEFLLGLSDGSLAAFPSVVHSRTRTASLPVGARGEARPIGSGMAAAADGGRLVFASADGSATVFDASTWRRLAELGPLPAHESPSPDPAQAAVMSLLGFVTRNHRILPPLPTAMAARGEKAAFLRGDAVSVWEADAASWHTLPVGPASILSLHFDADSILHACTADAAYAFVEGEWRRRFGMPAPEGWVALPHPLVVSPDGSALIRMVVKTTPEALLGVSQGVLAPETSLEAWDLGAGRVIWRGCRGRVAAAAAWSPDNSRIAVGLGGGSGHLVLNARSGEIVAALPDPMKMTSTRLAFSRDGRLLAGNGVQRRVRVWHGAEWLECLRRPFRPVDADDAPDGWNGPVLFLADDTLVYIDAATGRGETVDDDGAPDVLRSTLVLTAEELPRLSEPQQHAVSDMTQRVDNPLF